jgi:hypothetical protein
MNCERPGCTNGVSFTHTHDANSSIARINLSPEERAEKLADGDKTMAALIAAEIADAVKEALDKAFRYSHMCRDEHVQIGHNDSEHERCPLCIAIAEKEKAVEEDQLVRRDLREHDYQTGKADAYEDAAKQVCEKCKIKLNEHRR